MRPLALALAVAAALAAAPAPRPSSPRRSGCRAARPGPRAPRSKRSALDPLLPLCRNAKGDTLLATSFAYLVTGETTFYDRSWQTVRSRIYRNKAPTATAGLMPILELYQGTRTTPRYMGGVFSAPSPTSTTGATTVLPPARQDVVDWLNAAAGFAHLE